MEKRDIHSLTEEELKIWLEEQGEKSFHASQIFSWLHGRRVASFEEMTDISKALRQKLAERFYVRPLSVREIQTSALDGTKKYLYELSDGNLIESVFMPYREWNSVCVSSQVGCAMGCRFCASTVGGWIRNLTAGEMLQEVYGIARETGEKIGSVVVMGSGEPLLNYDNLLIFIRTLSAKGGMNLGMRNITVSTCGIVPQILNLAKEGLPINLAVSLHASGDEKRKKLMPIAEQYSIASILEVCRVYFESTGRRLTFEYALVQGVNDSKEDAMELAGLLKGINCYVNLIPVNSVRENSFRSPGREAARRFGELLKARGIQAALRREMGSDIDGACGQLRARRGKNV